MPTSSKPASSCRSESCATPLAVAPERHADQDSVIYRIPAMDCISEETAIRDALGSVAGVRRLRFELGSRKLAIVGPPAVQRAAVDAIQRAGFDAQEIHTQAAAAAGQAAEGRRNVTEAGVFRLGAALLLAVVAELLDYIAPAEALYEGLGMSLAVAGIALAGLGVYRKGLASLMHGRLDINALMAVAVTGAFLIGQWPEAAMVMALYAIAEMIEARAVDRARNAIGKLLELAPDAAEVRQDDGTWRTLPAADVPLDSTVRVKPGDVCRSMAS